MQLIPVIDLMKGNVVHAKRGERSSYLPLKSKLTESYQPEAVVNALLSVFSFRRLYIADIDSIQRQGSNYDVINQLHNLFPSLELWIDIGIKDKNDMDLFQWSSTLRPVVGSETLIDCSTLEQITKSYHPVLSLDFRDKQFFGPPELLTLPHYWTKDIIIMSLTHVGSDQGPDMERLQNFKKDISERNIYAAGGIREIADVVALERLGVAGALLASALHENKLPTEVIQRYA